jgi:hypothetical protein
LPHLRQAIPRTGLRIVRDPSPERESAGQHHTAHPMEAPILVVAMQADVDYLVTLDRKHYLDDLHVAASYGLRMGTPGDALGWAGGRLG